MGMVVPMVDTAEQARAAADACRLPPVGKRSWGVGRAQAMAMTTLIGSTNNSSWRFRSRVFKPSGRRKQSWPRRASTAVGQALADLALSMGLDPRKAGQDERHARALEQIVTACRKNTGKAPGLACPTPEDARQRAEQGFQFLTAGSDAGFMLGGARAGISTLGL